MPTYDIDVDVDDFYNDMDKYERQEMADLLYDNGYVPESIKDDLEIANERIPSSPNEQELTDILDKIWLNRRCIDNNDIQILIRLSKKGLY